MLRALLTPTFPSMLHHSCAYGMRHIFLGPVWLILLSLLVLSSKNVVNCDPPREPVTCSSGNSDCVLTNGYGSFPDRSTCYAANVVYPENEDQLISYVRDATKMKRKIKVITKYGHSIPKLVCTDGEDGLLISTKNLNKVIDVNTKQKTMTVESGMTLEELMNEAGKVNLALPSSPYFSGVTVGGMLGTGAHGSSILGRGSNVHDYVVGLKIISPGDAHDDYFKLRVLSDGDGDLDAAKVSLGVLGVISQVTFKLDPLFKRNITFISKEDDDLENEATTFGLESEFADIIWTPTEHKAIYRVDNRVPVTTPGNGVFDQLIFRPLPKAQLESARKQEEIEESNGCENLKCIGAKRVITTQVTRAFGLTNDGVVFTGYPVIGYQHKMQASGSCLHTQNNATADGYCRWDPRIKGQFYTNSAFALPMSKVPSFIKDVKKIAKLDPTSLCSFEFYLGFVFRYVKASSAYLGKDEDGIAFDVTYYRTREALGPRLNEDILEEIEQIAIFKYGGTPHWGKNRNVAFEGVIGKYKDAEKFIRVKERYDPLGLFSSEWTDQVLGLRGGISKSTKGCALEGLCRCDKDIDCGDEYNCVNGRVYEEARVCKEKKNNYNPKYCVT